MSRHSLERIVFIVGALGLAVACWVFGLNLLPSMAVAQEKGTVIPWMVTWAMIWITTLAAIGLAGFLILMGKAHHS